MEEVDELHYVLIHGACHGAWCWYKVVKQLRNWGYRVTALDMAASGINSKQVKELRSISEEFQPLMEFMAALQSEEKVVLVGHSRGGIAISMAMEKFPEKIAIAVFVTAAMYGPEITFKEVNKEFNQQLESFMDSQYTYDKGPDEPPTSLLLGPNFCSTMLYQLSSSEDMTLSNLLTRPFALYDDEELEKQTRVTMEKYGSVHRAYVVIEGDKTNKEKYQRWMIQQNPVDEVEFISGSDHMVMISKPKELSSCLISIANKFH